MMELTVKTVKATMKKPVAGLFPYYFDTAFVYLNDFFMGNLLYIIAVILIIGWLLGFFAFQVSSGIIHLLLVIAVILIIVKLVR